MKEPMTLDEWLSAVYKADSHNQSAAMLAKFSTALGGDALLRSNALARLVELNAMINVRGEQACSFSTKYRNYLQEVLV